MLAQSVEEAKMGIELQRRYFSTVESSEENLRSKFNRNFGPPQPV